ncbi:MAG: PIN domain-containing protein [Pseudomonadota bacterium]
MTTPKIYMDACCLLEVLKGAKGVSDQERAQQLDIITRTLRASRNGDVQVFTSMVSVSEVLYLDKNEKPPTDSNKLLIERLLMSGRDGVSIVSLVPTTVLTARDLSWNQSVYGRSVDMIHLASAIQAKAGELFTLDGRLAKKFDKDVVSGCRIIAPNETRLLPNDYKQGKLF